jgi:hypothetical protein
MKGKWLQPAVFVPVIVVALLLLAVRMVGDAREDDGLATRLGSDVGADTGHQVTYQVWGTGSANGDVEISYTGPDGSGRQASVPGAAAVWSESVVTDPGTWSTSLNASGPSSDLAFKLTCVIKVDGVEVKRDSQTFTCISQFEFADLPEALASASASAGAAAAAPPTTPAPEPTTPPACRYVDAGEMTILVSRAAGVTKPVLSVSAKGNRCTHVIDQDASSVSFEVERNGRSGGPPAVRVRAGKERAWYLEYSESMGELRVDLPGGDVFVVTVFFLGLRANGRQIAIDTYREARPRLLKGDR